MAIYGCIYIERIVYIDYVPYSGVLRVPSYDCHRAYLKSCGLVSCCMQGDRYLPDPAIPQNLTAG